MRQQPAASPVGLYGMLLFALCWLTLPTVFAPLERWLVGTTALLPRAIAGWSSVPAAAGEADAAAAAHARARALRERVERNDTAGARALLPVAWEPVHCVVRQVVDDRVRRGGGGRPGELRLDRTYAELGDCADIVTKGDALLGFLQRSGLGIAADDGPDDLARVVLLNHRSARPIGAALEQPDGGRLRLVVRAAAAIDQAPLLADLWDDPYRAARLDRSGQVVRTSTAAGDLEVPSGLLIGRTRIWGYEGFENDESLSIGVFVVPPIDARALSHVVVWRRGERTGFAPRDAAGARDGRRIGAVVHDLPGAAHGRRLLAAARRVPDGAAVVEGDRLIGTVQSLAFDSGLVTSFAASRHRWSLVLLPDDTAEAPRELDGRVEWCGGDTAWVSWRADAWDGAHVPLPAGELFTGCNGAHCPPGLWIGRAEPHAERRDVLVVTTDVATGARRVEVVVGGGEP